MQNLPKSYHSSFTNALWAKYNPLLRSLICNPYRATAGFPDISVGKESSYNAGDPDLIPGSGSSPGEGIGHPLQYSWASLVAQLVKNPM